jgi:hypothetical protein
LIGSFIGADNCLLGELSLHGRFVQIPEELFLRRDHPKASSRNKSREAQMHFFDPRARRRLILPVWRALAEDLRAIARGPVDTMVKLRLWLFMLRTALGARNEYLAELGEALGRRRAEGSTR